MTCFFVFVFHRFVCDSSLFHTENSDFLAVLNVGTYVFLRFGRQPYLPYLPAMQTHRYLRPSAGTKAELKVTGDKKLQTQAPR